MGSRLSRQKSPDQFRSARWYAQDDLRSFGHRSRFMQMGYDQEDWEGKPIIAILNSWSDINPCHVHFKDRVEDVRRGILQAGGMPVELPTLSLSEPFVKPTTMLYRNMMAMEVEELIRSHPIDGAVLMGGCDKTTPAMLMGAISAGVPAIFMPAGPMLRGNWKGQQLGSGSDAWKFWDERRAGNINQQEWQELEAGIARSHGHCMTMGTASTMTAIAEALGMSLHGSSSIPAPDANHNRMAAQTGRRAVEMVYEDLVAGKIITRKAVENASVVAMSMGASTNAVIHLVAIARRAGISFSIDDLDAYGRNIPVLANIRPSGQTYLMEDFYYAGGLRALLKRLEEFLTLEAMTVEGQALGDLLKDAEVYNDDVIRPLSDPIYPHGALAVLKGNLAPDGAVIKPAAMHKDLLEHEGPALVFDSYPEMKKAVEDPNLDVTAQHVMIFRNAGPIGGPGMPEWGMLPIPVKLVRQGVRDMVRISDARMSGTSYGACVLHVAPEAFLGGPLALVQNGDMIRLSVAERRLDLLVEEDELNKRRAKWVAPEPRAGRGYGWMFAQHIQQANLGCDFDYLQTDFGTSAREPDIF